MEIERINENTVKFYISYVDIEDRGFEKEEIWYDRERSEQLFWQMMDEINYKEDFSIEGPLWIQVQALEKGLEVIVTRAQISKDGISIDSIDGFDDALDLAIHEDAKQMLEEKLGEDTFDLPEDDYMDEMMWVTARFEDLEHIIQLSHQFLHEYESMCRTRLYHYDDEYYLYIEIHSDWMEYEEDILSQIFEYGVETNTTQHILQEYGKLVIEEDVFATLRKYFDL